MISSDNFRYVVASTSNELVRYDRRWKKTSRVAPCGGHEFDVREGKSHLLVVDSTDESRITLTVRAASDPSASVAEAAFDGEKWDFTGNSQAWAQVPEYLLINKDNKKSQILRIADNGELQTLHDLSGVQSITELPDSRLVILAGDGKLTIHDPIAAVSVAQFTLSGGNPDPIVHTKDSGKEVWVSDKDSLLRVNSRNWEVIDAAGSEGAPISYWEFGPAEDVCVVLRAEELNALVLDAQTMEPVAQHFFSRSIDQVMVISDDEILGFDSSEGTFHRPITQK